MKNHRKLRMKIGRSSSTSFSDPFLQNLQVSALTGPIERGSPNATSLGSASAQPCEDIP